MSNCGSGIELQVRPLRHIPYDTLVKPIGPAGWVVRHKGRVVRHGTGKTLAAAKVAARRQAGATGGLSGILDFFRPKRKKPRVGSKAIYIRAGSSSGNVFRGARRRKRR